jgi:transcriptional regulator with XRE-family HTH domain
VLEQKGVRGKRMGRQTADKDGPVWDDLEFRANVAAIARRQHRTLDEILESAGLSHNYLARAPNVGGRSITSIIRLARELDVTICELIEGAISCSIRPGETTDPRKSA